MWIYIIKLNERFQRGVRPYLNRVMIPTIRQHPRFCLSQLPVSSAEPFWSTLCGLDSVFDYSLVPGNEGLRRPPRKRRIQEVRGNRAITVITAGNDI